MSSLTDLPVWWPSFLLPVRSSCVSFPFTQEGYLIHRGRSTLAAVRERAEIENPSYEWAQPHHAAHFQAAPNAEVRYAELPVEFEQQVPEMTADALIRACRRG